MIAVDLLPLDAVLRSEPAQKGATLIKVADGSYCRNPRRARRVNDGDTILATLDVIASPEQIFRALTAREAEAWWGSADTDRITDWKADLVVGGTVDGPPR